MNDDRELTLIEHISEIRKRIIICFLFFIVSFVLLFPFSKYLLNILKLPVHGLIDKFVFFSPEEPFLIYMRLSVLSAIVISMPVFLYHLWAFIRPALDNNIRKNILYFVIICFISFLLGVAFAYFIILPRGLIFLLNLSGSELKPFISANRYISFVSYIIFGCGIVFQMPVISFILTKLKVINSRFLRKKYKYAVIILFIIAAIITPTTDIFNMLVMAIPMILLYEVSIWISKIT